MEFDKEQRLEVLRSKAWDAFVEKISAENDFNPIEFLSKEEAEEFMKLSGE